MTYQVPTTFVMKLSSRLLACGLLGALLALSLPALAQLTPSDDSYVNSKAATTNYGAAKTLDISSAADTTFIRFDLTAVPSSYTGSSIAKATLKLYVNTITPPAALTSIWSTARGPKEASTTAMRPRWAPPSPPVCRSQRQMNWITSPSTSRRPWSIG